MVEESRRLATQQIEGASSKNTELKISVIVCAYTEKRWDDLVAAIESLHQQTQPPFEIVIVIDHNTALYNRVRAEFPDLVAAENASPRGLSGARNTGIELVRGDIIAFMDDDAIASPDWIAQLVSGYHDPHVVGVGGTIEAAWAEGRPRWFPDEFDWVVGCTYRGVAETTQPTRNLIGCNMSFKRDVFTAVGGFRDGIGRVSTRPVGCEETELCIRVKQCWPDSIMLFEPGAHVAHRVPANRAGWKYFVSRCYAEGLSKALIASFVGSKDALSSERTYTFQTLPRGVWRGLKDAVVRRDVSGAQRAAAIVAGLGMTSIGYGVGVVSRRWAARKEARTAG